MTFDLTEVEAWISRFPPDGGHSHRLLVQVLHKHRHFCNSIRKTRLKTDDFRGDLDFTNSSFEVDGNMKDIIKGGVYKDLPCVHPLSLGFGDVDTEDSTFSHIHEMWGLGRYG